MGLCFADFACLDREEEEGEGEEGRRRRRILGRSSLLFLLLAPLPYFLLRCNQTFVYPARLLSPASTLQLERRRRTRGGGERVVCEGPPSPLLPPCFSLSPPQRATSNMRRGQEC